MSIRENLLVSNPTLSRIVHGYVPRRVFDGLPEAKRERLERLQEDFFELAELFVKGGEPAAFRRCWPRGRMPADVDIAGCYLRLSRVLLRMESVLARECTGFVDRYTQTVRRYAVDNPELDELEPVELDELERDVDLEGAPA